MGIEEEVLSKIMQEGSLLRLAERGITGLHFLSRHVEYEWVRDHTNEYQVPDRSTFVRRFPEFQFIEHLPEPMDYYLDRLRRQREYKLLTEALNTASAQVVENPETARHTLEATIRRIYSEVLELRDYSAENWQERLDQYNERARRTGGVLGIPTPWDGLDHLMLGLQNGHLITVAGRPKKGKSWLLSMLGVNAVRAGRRVLFMTMEMSAAEILRRVDAYYGEIPYDAFRRGELEPERVAQYERDMQAFNALDGEFHVTADADADGRVGVTFLEAKVRQYDPHLVLIDGVYLMHDEEEGRTKTERLYNITRGIKRVARRFNIPIVVSTQMGRSGRKREEAQGAAQIQWSDSFGQDSDEFIEMFQSQEMLDHHHQMCLVLQLQREGPPGSVTINWDFTEMKFEQAGQPRSGEFREDDLVARLGPDDDRS
jgi:replicative DNA helicase